MQDMFPYNFIIVDSPKFFSDIYYRTDVLSKVNIDIQLKPLIPVNFDSWEISTTLHGGLGNNLFQMGETISFCKKYNLPDPFLAHGIYGMVVVSILRHIILIDYLVDMMVQMKICKIHFQT